MSPSVVITGLGLVLPCGDGPEAARASLASGVPCFRELAPEFGIGRAAMCPDFKPAGIIPPMQLRRLDRASRYTWVAAAQAFADAGLDPKAFGGERIGLAAGTLSGGSEASEAFYRPYLDRGPEAASPLLFPNCVANAPSGYVAVTFGLKGPSATLLEREVAAFEALEQAQRWLRTGRCDAVLVLGLDSLFPLLTHVLQGARMTARHGDPTPMQGGGMLVGEGAQAFLLEREDDARARGARIRARIGGLACLAPDTERGDRAACLATAVAEVLDGPPTRWISGASGERRLDAAERPLWNRPDLPAPVTPKALWGEFCGCGGQLVGAALLEASPRVLVTGPASFGPQYALRLDAVVAP
ncbi:MAG TPA: beta-ketoacyl synthase N-terminal-like domain-containing protein [Holophagaceae bacterium]|nr:beta-ketoacyl synthase N-terminal-like domain-containing protein [Holophagaceae bacterium]